MTALLVDSHCHLDRLDLRPYDGQLSGALQHALRMGVGHMLCVSIDLESYPGIYTLAQQYPNVSLSVGIHPNEAGGHDPSTEELEQLARDPLVVAIGETGLDYFRSRGNLDWQRTRFRRHIAAAKRVGKPLIVHSREAIEDVLQILAGEGAAEVGGVMHCFVEDWEIAQRAIELNFYISFSGIVTFDKALVLKDVARRVPLTRMLVETDSPYLAPAPHRGKSNEPAYVRHVAEHIASLRSISYEEVAQATTENFFTLFPAARRP